MSLDPIWSEVTELVTGQYRPFLWNLARRYCPRCAWMQPEDLYSELVLEIYVGVLKGRLDIRCRRQFRQYAICRAISICRKALAKSRTNVQIDWELEYVDDISCGLREQEIMESLRRYLRERDFLIIKELVWPSNVTLALAERDAWAARAEAVASGRLKMRTRDPLNARPQKKHVAEVLGVAPSTVSRAISRCRQVIEHII